MGAPQAHPRDKWNAMQTVLSDRHVKSLKPASRRYDVRDAALPGLTIRVDANGTRVWSVIVSRGGIRQRVTIGRYPEVSLSEARRKAEERKQGGIRKSGTVKFAFEQYIEEIKKTRRAWRDVEQVGRLYMLPLLGHKKIDSLTADVSNVSAYGTNQRDFIREDFRLIVVTEGNEDETEIADTPDRCGQGDQGHPPGNA